MHKLAGRMDDFGEEWAYGIKGISKFSKSAAKALGEIKKSVEGLDDEIAGELRKSARTGGRGGRR